MTPEQFAPLIVRGFTGREAAVWILLPTDRLALFRRLVLALGQAELVLEEASWSSKFQAYVVAFRSTSAGTRTPVAAVAWANDARLAQMEVEYLEFLVAAFGTLADAAQALAEPQDFQQLDAARLRKSLEERLAARRTPVADLLALLAALGQRDDRGHGVLLDALTALAGRLRGLQLGRHAAEQRAERLEALLTEEQGLRAESQAALDMTQSELRELSEQTASQRFAVNRILYHKIATAGGRPDHAVLIGGKDRSIVLTAKPIWCTLPVRAGQPCVVTGRLRGTTGPRDALARIEFRDEKLAVLPGPYPKISVSERVGPFRYLAPDAAGVFEFDVPVPVGAASLRLGFQAWNRATNALFELDARITQRGTSRRLGPLAAEDDLVPLDDVVEFGEFPVIPDAPHALEGMLLAHPDEGPEAVFLELAFTDEIGRWISSPCEGLISVGRRAGLRVPTSGGAGAFRLVVQAPHNASRMRATLHTEGAQHPLYYRPVLRVRPLLSDRCKAGRAAILRLKPDQPRDHFIVLGKEPNWVRAPVVPQATYALHVRLPAHEAEDARAALLQVAFQDAEGREIEWNDARFRRSDVHGMYRYVPVGRAAEICLETLTAPPTAATLRLGLRAWQARGPVLVENQVLFGDAGAFSRLLLGALLADAQDQEHTTAGGVFLVQRCCDSPRLERTRLGPNDWLFLLTSAASVAVLIDLAQDFEHSEWAGLLARYGDVHADTLYALIEFASERGIPIVIHVPAGAAAPPQSLAKLADRLVVGTVAQAPAGTPPGHVVAGRDWRSVVEELEAARPPAEKELAQ